MISIITPLYKAGRYIEQTVKSVLAQTYTDWEWILVDDHSPDDTVPVLKDCLGKEGLVPEPDGLTFVLPGGENAEQPARKVRLILLEENAGAANARNTGLDLAEGRYIAFLDADDVWLPGRLATCMDHMHHICADVDENCGFVFTAYEFGDEDAKGTGRIVHVPDKLTYDKALSRTVIFTTTTLFDKEKIPEELLHMPNVASEDTATWWQILRAGHAAYGIDEVTAVYRRPAASLSSNKIEAVKRIWNLYRNVEKLSFIKSGISLAGWAYRATVRRI